MKYKSDFLCPKHITRDKCQMAPVFCLFCWLVDMQCVSDGCYWLAQEGTTKLTTRVQSGGGKPLFTVVFIMQVEVQCVARNSMIILRCDTRSFKNKTMPPCKCTVICDWTMRLCLVYVYTFFSYYLMCILKHWITCMKVNVNLFCEYSNAILPMLVK